MALAGWFYRPYERREKVRVGQPLENIAAKIQTDHFNSDVSISKIKRSRLSCGIHFQFSGGIKSSISV